MSEPAESPVLASEYTPVRTRLCCGRQHNGPVCPDGLVMCCICFTRAAPEDLYTDPEGSRWDICVSCADAEQRHHQEES
jgi:hypothetical protein